jgi:hypothetical protein
VADIALYRHLASEAGGWKAQAQQLNDFGAAYHRMQTRFEDGYGLYGAADHTETARGPPLLDGATRLRRSPLP